MGFQGVHMRLPFIPVMSMAVRLPWLPQDPSPAETPIAEPVEACAAAEQAEINEEAAEEPTGEVTPLASRDESRENTLQGKPRDD